MGCFLRQHDKSNGDNLTIIVIPTKEESHNTNYDDRNDEMLPASA